MNRSHDASGPSSADGRPVFPHRLPLAIGSVIIASSACAGTPNTSFELDVPTAVSTAAAWYEIGVLPKSCPSQSLLLGGIPSDGTVARLAFAAHATAPPLGMLPKGTYGVAAVARAADCSVIATGCSLVDVNSGAPLTISLAAVTGTGAGCEAGSACTDAHCLPTGEAGAPSNAEGCSLQLVGAGPLADPLAEGSTLLSSPAIAATPGGFLIAYREFDTSAGTARLTTIALDPSGGAAAPIQTTLQGSCSGSPASDATAVAFAGASGTIAVSRPPCAGDGGAGAGGIDLFAVNAGGTITMSAFNGQDGLDLALAPGRALAYGPLGLLLAYTNKGTSKAFAASISGTTLAPAAPLAYESFSGFASTSTAIVTATALGSAFVSLGEGGADASASGSSLNIASATSDAGLTAAESSTFAAKWAAASSVGNRVIVASNGPSKDESILWSAFDLGVKDAAHTATFSPESAGDVAYVDVALQQDHAFFAAAVDADISLFVFEKASTFPLEIGELVFSSQPNIPLGRLRDGLVAVAASDARVAVVWGTARSLGSDDDVGGYAIFECSP